MTVYPRIIVRDFGPFEQADLELKPITLLIGRNSVGKSMLSYLAWTLTSLVPDFEKLGEILTRNDVDEIAKEILGEIKKGLNPKEKIKKLVKMHIEALPEAIASGLKDILQRTFMVRVRELIREGASKAIIRVMGPYAALELTLEGDDIKITYHRPYLEFIEKLKLSVPRPSTLKIVHADGHEYEETLTSVSDLASTMVSVLASYTVTVFYPFFASPLTALLPDSRAGISRTLLKPYTRPALAKGISYVDEQFIDLYFRLAEYVDEGLVDLDMVKPLLRELGCTLEVVFEKGVYTVYVRTWTGKRLPLPQAPSGIRESLTVALALASKKDPQLVVIEEPEAHLHPRAQLLLSRLIARAVNKYGKTVLITTHSDYVVYTINNLITLSQSLEKAEKLGYQRTEVLDPGKVVAYLVKAEEGKAVLEHLEVSSTGIPEDEFAKIAEELAEERARILA